jgi:hypothetical protein
MSETIRWLSSWHNLVSFRFAACVRTTFAPIVHVGQGSQQRDTPSNYRGGEEKGGGVWEPWPWPSVGQASTHRSMQYVSAEIEGLHREHRARTLRSKDYTPDTVAKISGDTTNKHHAAVLLCEDDNALVDKCPVFYVTRSFIVFTKSRHWFLSWPHEYSRNPYALFAEDAF